MELVRILVQPFPGSGKVKLLTTGKYRPKVVEVATSTELFAEFRLYKKWLIQENGAAVDVVVPNLFQAFLELKAIPPPPVPQVKYCSICGKEITDKEKLNLRRAAHEHCVQEEGLFSVNMVEPLVGWKGWYIDPVHPSCLTTQYHTRWIPENPIQARCPDGRHQQSPADACGCGIYAADSFHGANQGPNIIRGQIYGWGRYIRGGLGWRCQFAYPKSFIIEKEQMQHFEMLKAYRVPIFVYEPLKIYDPSDDGYEGEDDEYRGNQKNGDSGTD